MTRPTEGETRADPRLDGHLRRGSRPASPPAVRGEDRYRLLLIEDSDPAARLFEDVLATSGLDAELSRAGTLEEGRAAAAPEDVDLLLLDLGLPGSRGIETVERAQAAFGPVPTVVLTGLQDETVALDALRRGVEEYLLKDELTPRALARTVRYVVVRDRFRRRMREERAFSRAVLRSLSEHIAVLDADGRILETNPAWNAFARRNGGDPDGYRGHSYLEAARRAAASDEYARRMAWGLGQVLSGARREFTLEYPCHAPDEARWFRVTVTPMLSAAGGAVVSHADVTDRRLAEDELRTSEERYAAIVETAPVGIMLSDAESAEVHEVNRAFEAISGYGRDELLGSSKVDLGIWERVAARDAIVGRVRREGAASDVDATLVRADGRRVNALVSCRRLGVEDLLLWTVEDVTDRLQRQQALERSEERYRSLFQNSLDPISVTHRDGRALEVNDAWCELFGVGREEVGSLSVEELYVDPEDRRRIYELLDRDGGFRDYECRVRRRDGAVRVCRITGTARVTDDGRVTVVQAIYRDVTERKRLERELEHRALHDALTGLPNRTLLADRAELALARARRERTSVALMMLDLDRFKLVNDSLGHTAGDRVLVEVGRRLTATFREEDTVARVGGDEFAVLLAEVTSDSDLDRLVARAERALVEPFTLAEGECTLTASVGVVGYGGGLGPDGVAVDGHGDLMRYADLALTRAKSDPVLRHHRFDPDVDLEAAARLHREQELRRAIERDEFTIHYQPIVRLADGELVGLEPLARWAHPERGLLAPDAFIPLAEETGMIHELGQLLLGKACRWLADLRARRPDAARLVITPNLSGRQFEDPGLAEKLKALLDECGLPADRLHVEVTETAIARAMEQIERLKEVGVRVAVDDFGTGYSSLTYVRELAVDGIKIDMSFVQGLTADDRDAAIVEAVLTLGRALGLATVAEGIETAEQRARLRELGCEFGQGYHFSRPLTGDEAAALV